MIKAMTMPNEPASSNPVVYSDFPTTPTHLRNRRKSDTPTGGDGGNGMEARLAKVESDVEYIKRDVTEIKDDLKSFRNASLKWLIKAIIFLCATILASDFFL